MESFSVYSFLIYLVFLPLPIIIIEPSLTIEPKTASTVVALTSGNFLQISAFDIGVKLFNIVASILAFFVILLLFFSLHLLPLSKY